MHLPAVTARREGVGGWGGGGGWAGPGALLTGVMAEKSSNPAVASLENTLLNTTTCDMGAWRAGLHSRCRIRHGRAFNGPISSPQGFNHRSVTGGVLAAACVGTDSLAIGTSSGDRRPPVPAGHWCF